MTEITHTHTLLRVTEVKCEGENNMQGVLTQTSLHQIPKGSCLCCVIFGNKNLKSNNQIESI